MNPSLEEEWLEVEAAYPDANHAEGPERVTLTISLEDDLYDRAAVEVAVLVPPGYRATPPDGFLVPVGLALSNGEALPVSDASGLQMPGWWLVSFHMADLDGRSTWNPTADPQVGDNFVGYVMSVEAFLAARCN